MPYIAAGSENTTTDLYYEDHSSRSWKLWFRPARKSQNAERNTMREVMAEPCRRFGRTSLAVRAFVVAAAALVAVPGVAFADPPPALPQNAPLGDSWYEPVFDYDNDGCYPTPAIGSNGQIATGLEIGGAVNGSCHDAWDLDNTNAYSRSKCNNGWCAYMYALYFEKDQTVAGPGGNGHRHDLEHVVVWLQDGNQWPQYVSTSAHNEYNIRSRNDIQWDRAGLKAKIVYHKEGAGGSHSFRFANSGEQPENHKKAWQSPPVVGWNGYPSDFRNRLMNHNFGDAQFDIKDDRFADQLSKAKPGNIPFNPRG